MDFSNIFEQAQNMQSRLAEIQQKLAQKTITGSAGGGMVTATVSGKGEILAVSIEEPLLSVQEKEMLQDLITAAVNDGLRRAKELAHEEMRSLTGGISIPGITDMF